MQLLSPAQDDSFYDWWLASRKQVPKIKRRGFDELVLLVGWMLWKERNARTFRGETRSANQLVLAIQEDAMQWIHAVFKQLTSLIDQG